MTWRHFAATGAGGQILDSARTMGTGKDARSRRIVYQYSFKRHKHDDRTINAHDRPTSRVMSFAASTLPAEDVDRYGPRQAND